MIFILSFLLCLTYEDVLVYPKYGFIKDQKDANIIAIIDDIITKNILIDFSSPSVENIVNTENSNCNLYKAK